MGLSRRSFLIAGLALAGCQIEPAFKNQAGRRLALRLPEPKGRRDFIFIQELERYVDHDSNAEFALSYSIGTSTLTVSTRTQITATMNYTLRDIEAGLILGSGTKKTLVSYRKDQDSMIATLASDDAMARYASDLATQLADQLRRDLAL